MLRKRSGSIIWGQVALPKWDQSEQEMISKRVSPVTLTWPPRCRTWFYVHGGKLDPETGLVMVKASLKEAADEILIAIEEARTGMFTPNRDNDELTRALKNAEHQEEHEAKALFRGMRGLRIGTTTIEAVRERRSRRSRRRRRKHSALKA